jgi:HEAT repeat protein
LSDHVPSIRLAVAYAIGELGPNHPRALKALISAINDADDDVREEIVFAIGEIGTDEKPVIDVLQQALKDPSPVVCEAAQEAIDKLQGDDDDRDTERPTTKKAAPPKR